LSFWHQQRLQGFHSVLAFRLKTSASIRKAHSEQPLSVTGTFPAGLLPPVFSPLGLFHAGFFPSDFYFSSYEEKTMKQAIP